MNANPEFMKDFLLNHEISGKVAAADISDGFTAKNLAGNDMTFKVTDDGGVTVGGAKLVGTDIAVGKGVTVHILDSVFSPAMAFDISQFEISPAKLLGGQ